MKNRGLTLLLLAATMAVLAGLFFKSSRRNQAQKNIPTFEKGFQKDQSLKEKIATQKQTTRLPTQTAAGNLERQIPKTSLVRTRPLVIPSTDVLQNLVSTTVDQRWKWWINTLVIPKSEYLEDRDKALAEVSQKIVVEKRKPGSSPEEFFPESPLVLFDPLKKSVGVLTGVYVITAKSDQDFSELLQDQNLDVVNSFTHLRVLYVKPRKVPFNLSEVESLLSADHRIHSLEYEILKGNLVKN